MSDAPLGRKIELAQVKVTVIVCEGCWDRDKPAQRYTIGFPNGPSRRAIDLCEDCAAPLERFRPEHTPKRGRRVYTPDEIESLLSRE